MSKRSILNTTSRKKRNDMLTYSNTAADGTIGTSTLKQPVNVRGNSTFFSIWTPTSMNMQRDGGLNTINDVAARTSRTCYMRGLSEKLRIQTSSSVPWFHRRICFTSTDHSWVNAPYRTNADGSTNNLSSFIDVPGEGMQRQFFNYSDNSTYDTLFSYYQDILFKGQKTTDWNDFMTAKIDTNRVNLKYDRLRTINSGNSSGVARQMSFWHPMNKNLYYSEDEVGETSSAAFASAEGNRGMGNYVVIDIIQAGAAATATDLYRISAEATLYWHEK